jgi:uncharacterized protein (UPF0210 family)
MKVRSITCFINPNTKDFDSILQSLSNLMADCRNELQDQGWELQTTRLATTPFGSYTTSTTAIQKTRELEKIAVSRGFDYLSIGPARLTVQKDYELVPAILAETENVFTSAFLSHPQKGISRDAVKGCSQIITRSAAITPDGFTNLRFCAMSGVQPFTPFFPAAYSYGDALAFSAAIECADAAVEAFKTANSINDGKNQLTMKLDQAAVQLTRIFSSAARKYQVIFKGFDFSLAPFPEDSCSLGAALESLGIKLGNLGSLTSAAILADALDHGKWQRAGFNGLMLPVLEDSRLAERSEDQKLSVKDLLMYSAVCGTGLDTVPLPGKITPEELEPLLMDLAALSLRLKKPLTARLMPVPALAAGDKTNFDFDFFHNGGIMEYPVQALNGLLEESKWAAVRNRHTYF